MNVEAPGPIDAPVSRVTVLKVKTQRTELVSRVPTRLTLNKSPKKRTDGPHTKHLGSRNEESPDMQLLHGGGGKLGAEGWLPVRRHSLARVVREHLVQSLVLLGVIGPAGAEGSRMGVKEWQGVPSRDGHATSAVWKYGSTSQGPVLGSVHLDPVRHRVCYDPPQ